MINGAPTDNNARLLREECFGPILPVVPYDTEDDAVAAEYLAMVLEKAGYRVDTVADAAASRTLLGRWKYAAWLLSRRLRDAEDALALIAEMRDRLEGTRIIMLAGLRSDQAGVPEPSHVLHLALAW